MFHWLKLKYLKLRMRWMALWADKVPVSQEWTTWTPSGIDTSVYVDGEKLSNVMSLGWVEWRANGGREWNCTLTITQLCGMIHKDRGLHPMLLMNQEIKDLKMVSVMEGGRKWERSWKDLRVTGVTGKVSVDGLIIEEEVTISAKAKYL